MNKYFERLVKKNRVRNIAHQNKRNIILSHQFTVGYFVLVRNDQDKDQNLSYIWMVPSIIKGVKMEHVYNVENTMERKEEKINSGMDGKKISVELMKQIKRSQAKYELNEEVMGISDKHTDGILILLQWIRLTYKNECTSKQIKEIHEDIP